ncbi:MAG TPA: hypothetical protein VMS63_01005 [Gaiellaceae bacterium]|nr:hypothetical protein [Gaiellaceae bacterium]
MHFLSLAAAVPALGWPPRPRRSGSSPRSEWRSAPATTTDGALIATIGALLTLGPLRIFAYRVIRRVRPEVDRLLVEIPAGGSPAPVIEMIELQGGRVVSLDVAQEGDRRSIAVDVEMHKPAAPTIVANVADIDGVLEVRWME